MGIASLALFLAGCHAGPSVVPPGLPSGQASFNPAETTGRTLVVRLDQAVGTDLSHLGEKVVAHVAAPLADRAGRILIPDGARVEGRITRCVGGKGIATPRLELVFDRIIVDGVDGRDRRSWTIHGVVASADFEVKSPGLDGEVISRGRLGGAVLGMIFFNLPGAVIGYSLGGTAGSVEAISERQAAARLPRGSFLTLRLLPRA